MTRRVERVAEEIRTEVALILAERLKDPRIGFVTVTRVDVTSDLHLARVYVGVLGGPPERQRTLECLRQASAFVRRQLGQRIRMRFTPEILFEYDKGLDASDRVARLLEEVRPPPEPDESEEE